MADAKTSDKPDAVWAKDATIQFAARAGGDYIAQDVAARRIFGELERAIKSGEVPVYLRGVVGMVERKARAQEPTFPTGDYQVKRELIAQLADARKFKVVPGGLKL